MSGVTLSDRHCGIHTKTTATAHGTVPCQRRCILGLKPVYIDSNEAAILSSRLIVRKDNLSPSSSSTSNTSERLKR